MGLRHRCFAVTTIAVFLAAVTAPMHGQTTQAQPCTGSENEVTQTANTISTTSTALTNTGTTLAANEAKLKSAFGWGKKPASTTTTTAAKPAATPATSTTAGGAAKPAAPCPAKAASGPTPGSTGGATSAAAAAHPASVAATTPATGSAFVRPGGYVGPVSWTYRTGEDPNPTLLYTGANGATETATYMGYDSAGDYITLGSDASGLSGHTLRVKNGAVTDIGNQVPTDLTKTVYAPPHPAAAKVASAPAVAVVSGTPSFTLMPDGQYMVSYDAPDPPHKKAYVRVKKVSATAQAGHPNDGVYTDDKSFYVVTAGQMVITPVNTESPH